MDSMQNEEIRPVTELTFKQASVELELVVRQLEKGDLELEETLVAYARGVELLDELRRRLAAAEAKVAEMQAGVYGVGEPASNTAQAPF